LVTQVDAPQVDRDNAVRAAKMDDLVPPSFPEIRQPVNKDQGRPVPRHGVVKADIASVKKPRSILTLNHSIMIRAIFVSQK
jgi:hypothetical protein